MAVIAILELAFKPDALDEARVIVRDILATPARSRVAWASTF